MKKYKILILILSLIIMIKCSPYAKIIKTNNYKSANENIEVNPELKVIAFPGEFIFKINLEVINNENSDYILDSNSLKLYVKTQNDSTLVKTTLMHNSKKRINDMKTELSFKGYYNDSLFLKKPDIIKQSYFQLYVYLEYKNSKIKYGPWNFEFKNKSGMTKSLIKPKNDY